MITLTGQVLKAEWREFGEGDKKRRVFFGVIGDTDIFCQCQLSGQAPADLAVGERISFQCTKEPQSTKWGVRYEGVATREKQSK